MFNSHYFYSGVFGTEGAHLLGYKFLEKQFFSLTLTIIITSTDPDTRLFWTCKDLVNLSPDLETRPVIHRPQPKYSSVTNPDLSFTHDTNLFFLSSTLYFPHDYIMSGGL